MEFILSLSSPHLSSLPFLSSLFSLYLSLFSSFFCFLSPLPSLFHCSFLPFLLFLSFLLFCLSFILSHFFFSCLPSHLLPFSLALLSCICILSLSPFCFYPSSKKTNNKPNPSSSFCPLSIFLSCPSPSHLPSQSPFLWLHTWTFSYPFLSPSLFVFF